MAMLSLNLKMEYGLKWRVHCKNWFVDLTNILLYRLHVANLIWCKSKHNTVYVVNISQLVIIYFAA